MCHSAFSLMPVVHMLHGPRKNMLPSPACGNCGGFALCCRQLTPLARNLPAGRIVSCVLSCTCSWQLTLGEIPWERYLGRDTLGEIPWERYLGRDTLKPTRRDIPREIYFESRQTSSPTPTTPCHPVCRRCSHRCSEIKALPWGSNLWV